MQFTRESAERIANVVRAAETAPPPASPLTFDLRMQDRVPKQVRAATFSGSWPIGLTKIVTFSYTPTATANVTNLSWPITDTAYANENCLVGKEGTNWWLVVPVLERRTAMFLTNVSIQATLNTNSCEITVSQTQGTASISYLRLRVP